VRTFLPESVAYTVRNKRLDFSIAILDVNLLHLHEELIFELLEHLTHSIKADGFIRHPIIVDKESLVVLDGVHRVAALKKLNIKRIPACLVDYKSPRIKVLSWYRTITNASNPQQILMQVKKAGITPRETGEFDESVIGVFPTAAVIKFRNQTFLINFAFKNHIEAYKIIEQIERQLKADGLTVKHETESDALRNLQAERVDAVICTPKLTKKEIIEVAVSGQVFASKTTRHVVPARPMHLNVPLNLLRNDKKPLVEVNEELKRMLQQRRLKRLPSGSVLDGRRYEEELYVFEE